MKVWVNTSHNGSWNGSFDLLLKRTAYQGTVSGSSFVGEVHLPLRLGACPHLLADHPVGPSIGGQARRLIRKRRYDHALGDEPVPISTRFSA